MDADAVNGLVSAGGVAVALIATGIAIRANGIAKQGNGLARTANETADDALDEARKANDIAKDANSIADRALRVAQDDIPYRWVLRVDDNGSAWVINDCGHAAGQVSVVIDAAGQVVGETGPADVAPFGELSFELKDAVEQHFARVRQHPYRPASGGGGVFIAGSSGKPVDTTFRAHLRWLTDDQVPRTDVIEETLRHSMGRDGMKRLGLRK